MYRLVAKFQEQYQFHFAVSGHEGVNKEQNEDGAIINPTVTLEAQDQIRKGSTFSKRCISKNVNRKL